jgi:hypothetical protein
MAATAAPIIVRRFVFRGGVVACGGVIAWRSSDVTPEDCRVSRSERPCRLVAPTHSPRSPRRTSESRLSRPSSANAFNSRPRRGPYCLSPIVTNHSRATLDQPFFSRGGRILTDGHFRCGSVDDSTSELRRGYQKGMPLLFQEFAISVVARVSFCGVPTKRLALRRVKNRSSLHARCTFRQCRTVIQTGFTQIVRRPTVRIRRDFAGDGAIGSRTGLSIRALRFEFP